MVAFTLTSPAFGAGDVIPPQYTGDGPDLSPPLAWTAPPAGTKSLALIADDPDAPGGTWVHWILIGIPPDLGKLPEGVESAARPGGLGGAASGRNDFDHLGYGGPAPPRGPVHRYFFKLYALDANLALRSGATKAEVERAMKGHILAKAELMGRYQRK
jgi:Raf kinase inhibitor-like YbhB/YbcL family protein